jgi:hypothetical protein
MGDSMDGKGKQREVIKPNSEACTNKAILVFGTIVNACAELPHVTTAGKGQPWWGRESAFECTE